MLFAKHIADELVDDNSVSRWEFQTDVRSGRLVLTEQVLINGTPHHSRTFSARSRDLDPERISLEREDSSGVRHLTAISALYRKAVEATCVSPDWPLRREQLVKLRLPMGRDLVEPEQIVGSFREFLVTCGAKPIPVCSGLIRDLLAHLHGALGPASGVRVSNQAGTDWCEYATRLDEDLLLLRKEMRRGQRLRQSWSFELLSLDTAAVYVRKGAGCWAVTLPSLERIETTMWRISPTVQERWWYMDVLFPAQAQAEHFAAICARVVPEIQQCLYAAHFEN